jgi:flagellar biosynthesis/type III secretory pathway M-ring protein FliF/YscJ
MNGDQNNTNGPARPTKLIGKIIIISLVFLILVGLIWFLVSRTGKLSPEEKLKQEALKEQQALQKAVAKMEETDKDLDGLKDSEEEKLGTDPNISDTDSDGLLDKAEIELHKTDPLNPDTDGDGKRDGFEVLRGMDPNTP